MGGVGVISMGELTKADYQPPENRVGVSGGGIFDKCENSSSKCWHQQNTLTIILIRDVLF